jgi:predicted porin
MQKKLLAVAVAGALGAPAVAMAQASTVQVRGQIYMEYGYVDQGRATATTDRVNVDMFQTPGSNITFLGTEKLGGGLSAWFQCESTFDVRGASPQGFCGRNSAIGFRGAFGNIFLGNWDTPFKRTIGPTRTGINETGLFGGSFLQTGGSSSFSGAATRGSFTRRQNNSVNYETPNFNGFQVLASYSTTNHATANTTNLTNAKPRMWSLGAQYSAGPLYVGGGYERHRDFGAGNTGGGLPGSTDSGWHLGAAYTFGGAVRVGGNYTNQKFRNVGAIGADTEYRIWHVGADWKIQGPHGLRGGLTYARDAKGTGGAVAGSGVTRPAAGPDSGARLWQIQYVHTLSKRTELTAGYVKLNNKANAAYNLGGLSTPLAGENQDAFAMSIRHRF